MVILHKMRPAMRFSDDFIVPLYYFFIIFASTKAFLSD